MAKLYFRYGAMGSSKSANAVMVRFNYLERGQKCVMLKPRLDVRDGEKLVASRCGLTAPCEYIEDIDSIDLTGMDCVIVDEAQFLTKAQVEKLVRIADDLNIPVALGVLFNLVKETKSKEVYNLILDFDRVFGLSLDKVAEPKVENNNEGAPAEIMDLVEKRQAAKKEKNFALADEIRGKISDLGYEVKDTRDGPVVTKK